MLIHEIHSTRLREVALLPPTSPAPKLDLHPFLLLLENKQVFQE